MITLERLKEPGLASGLVPREIYCDPNVLALEQERIFRKTWHYACTLHDLKQPGDFYTLSVADEPVLVVRDRGGHLRAFYNACTHRGAILTDARCGNGGQGFTCMYHGWGFNLAGELVGVPYDKAYPTDFRREDYGLVPVSVDTFEDLVFVALDPTVPTLAEFLGEEMSEHLRPYVSGIEPIGRNSWIYEGNWKLWHENFRDNYHPQFAHRSINYQTPHYADHGENRGVPPGHSVLQYISLLPRNMESYARSLERFSGIPFTEVVPRADHALRTPDQAPSPREILAVFPNFDLQPEAKLSKDRMKRGFIQTVTPVGVNRAKVEITVYSDPHEDEARRRASLENLAHGQGSWGKIACDDTEAAYRCQIGLRGRGTRYSLFTRGTAPGFGGAGSDSRDEYSQREFYRVYQEYMTLEDRA